MQATKVHDIADRRKRYTRKTGVEFLREQGYPITLRQFQDACRPGGRDGGRGPRPCGRFGREFVYDAPTLLAWAEAQAKAGLGDEP
jgi:hypothetical protein